MAGTQDIYRLRLPNGEPEQITTDPADEFEPTWSPDASQIAFQAWPGDDRDIFLIGADGHGRQRLTNEPDHQWFPSWSPDGTRIAFSDNKRNGISMVRHTAAGWSAPSLVTTAPMGFIPFFSPDGRSLLLVGGTSNASSELRVVPMDDRPPRTLFTGLLPNGAAVTFSRWSRDGRRVFVFGIDAEGRSSMWSIPSEGGTPTLLVRFDDPTRESNRREFDVDGEHIYFTLARKEGDVWVMDVR